MLRFCRPQCRSFAVTRTFGPKDVALFADLVSDHNPLHLDDEVAAESRFGRRVVHGMLTSSLFSGLIGTNVPGAIYCAQDLKFTAPVFVDELIQAKVTVSKLIPSKRMAVLDTQVLKSDGTVAVKGHATVLVPRSVPLDLGRDAEY
ncbi:MAG: hypothetical protein MHM6MM_003961 [Cercozoa sp. M6MM]